MRSLRTLLFSIVLAGFLFCAVSTSQAQVARPSDCTPKQLDVKLVPRSELKTKSVGHLLAVEIQNRDQAPCFLPPLTARYSPGDPIQWSEPDTSQAALAFKQKSQQLDKGETVHQLVTWSSAPIQLSGIVMDNCATHDNLTLNWGYSTTKNSLLDVRNLGMRSCGQIWQSSYRLGPYVPGEPIAKEWLARTHLKESDFVTRITDTATAGLRALSVVQYLNEPGYFSYFELFLKVVSPAFADCPFRSLRKREADGETIIYLNDCENASGRPPQRAPKETRLVIKQFGLEPERPGKVTYDVVSDAMQKGKRTLAYAETELSIRDPRQPMLPAIEMVAPDCRASQMKLTSPAVELGSHWARPRAYAPPGQEWNDGKVFELTNVSSQTCRLGGVPELKILNPPEISSGSLVATVCRNCATPLFKPRESQWIEVKPNESAHFIVGRTVLDSDYGFQCVVMGGFDMSLPGDNQPIRLPFEVGYCGQLAVSAWRAGRYDADPMNIEYDRNEHEREQRRIASGMRVPSGCVSDVSEDTGQPLMFGSVGSLTWGLSTKSLPYGEAVPVILWVCNTTDGPQSVMTCSDIGRFWGAGVDLFDSYGHRVLSTAEEEEEKLRKSGRTTLHIGSGILCNDSKINIPPLNSIHGSFSKPGFLSLQTPYAPPPGRYFIAPSKREPDAYAPYSRMLSDSESGLLVVVESQ